jgi:hypothetical protein
MRRLPPLVLSVWWILAAAAGSVITAGENKMPKENSFVEIAPYAHVRTWQGPPIRYTGKVTLLTPADLPREDAVWTIAPAGDGADVNFGLEWDEPRNPTVLSIVYDDAQSPRGMESQELQAWLRPGKGLAGGESPSQGEWRPLTGEEGFSVEANGDSWLYRLPPIENGIFKLRVVLKRNAGTRVKSVSVLTESRWRKTEFGVRFSPARNKAENVVEGYNARVVSVVPLENADGYKVQALASDAPSDSNDRAMFTIRDDNRSFSFLLSDLEADGEIRIPAFGATVSRPGAKASAPEGRTITERLLGMPEQTFDRALAAVPPKQRNKWLSLSPPLNPRKFAVQPSGEFFYRYETDRRYQFATGDQPDYEQTKSQHVERDFLPILISDWRTDDLVWRQEYVVPSFGGTFDDPSSDTVLVTRVSVTNTGNSPTEARLWFCLRNGGECSEVRVVNGLILDGDRARAMITAEGWRTEPRDRQICCIAPVQPGETRSFEIEVPSFETDAPWTKVGYDAARERTIEYWQRKLAEGADFIVPDDRVNRLWKSLLIHQYCWGDYDEQNDTYLPNVAAFAYGPVGNESSQMAKALDFFGHAQMAEEYYEEMWKDQGSNRIAARATNGRGCLVGWWPHYVFNTGFQLWNLTNHYRLTGDRAWLDQVLPHMIKACDWLAEQRRTTVAKDAAGRPVLESGFFPPCGLEDEGRWFYWTMTNGYFCLGMESVADLLADIGHPEAARIARESEDYLRDLRRGFRESIVRCPVVKLRDGSFVPYVPKHLHRRGRSEGFYEAELASLHLITTNVYAPDSREMDWTLQFLEDVVFMTEAPSHDSIISFADIERDWFDLGGYGKTQPYLVHTQVAYLRRDQPKLFLRSFWNQLVAQNFRDINAFPEHICWQGAADCKTYEEAMWLQQFRSMLVFDEDNLLRLSAAAPREWFAEGKTISVRNAPTFYGPVSYEIRSRVDNDRITAEIQFAQRKEPASFLIRFRHPTEAKMKSVTVNGMPWDRFDAADETVLLPAGQKDIEVVVSY